MPMLAEALRGVPKAALRTVLGNDLGKRAWEAASAGSRTPVGQAEINDEQIIAGLLAHLSQRASASLRRERRRALVISLCLQDAEGSSLFGHVRLPRASDDSIEILSHAESLYRRLTSEYSGRSPGFSASIRRLELDVTVTLTEADPNPASWPTRRWRAQAAAGLH